MLMAGLPQSAALPFALSMAYLKLGTKSFVRSRWRNVAYATRYGKGCSLQDALSLDVKSMGDYIEAVAFCVEQEAKAAKPCANILTALF